MNDPLEPVAARPAVVGRDGVSVRGGAVSISGLATIPDIVGRPRVPPRGSKVPTVPADGHRSSRFRSTRSPSVQSRAPRWWERRAPRPRNSSALMRRSPRPGDWLRVSSTTIPRRSRPARASRRTSTLFSPTPAVKVMTSTPTEFDHVRADVVAQPMDVDVVGEFRGAGRRRRPCCSSARKSFTPHRPLSPERRLSRSSMSSTLIPALRFRCSMTPASMSPLRVPITRPSSGVNPIDVSIGAPPADRRRRRPVAEVQHDLIQLRGVAVQERRDLARHVLV